MEPSRGELETIIEADEQTVERVEPEILREEVQKVRKLASEVESEDE